MSIVNKTLFLELFPFFRDVSQSLVEDILSSSRHNKIPGNILVNLEGDLCKDFVLMLSGEMRVFKMGRTDREITLYEMGPGDICVLNASSILSNATLSANAATITETDVLLLPSQYFLDMVATYEEMRFFVHSRINESITSIMTLVSEIAFGKMDDRLVDYLTEKSENGMLKRTHQKIAYDLGTSREVVSRLLKNFERQDLVVLSRNFIQLKNL